jgi:hypothetical protein
MGAKIVLTGQAKNIQKDDHVVSFHIIAGPTTQHPPRGLKLYGQVRYHVECSARQWRRARQDPSDDSDLMIEGYLEPRREPETGKLYIAVVATSLQSTQVQNMRKLEQLSEVLEQARQAYVQARESGASESELEKVAAAFVRANESVCQFLGKHPELSSKELS